MGIIIPGSCGPPPVDRMVHFSLAGGRRYGNRCLCIQPVFFSLLAFIVSLLHGLIATCFVVSMMRRDAVSDSRGGKRTSSVQFPEIYLTRHYMVLLPSWFRSWYWLPWHGFLTILNLVYILVLITVILAAVTTIIGARIDQLLHPCQVHQLS